MDRILDAITKEGKGLSEGESFVWLDWRGGLSARRYALGFWQVVEGRDIKSFSTLNECTSAFARAWQKMGEVVAHHDVIVDAVTNAAMEGPLTWHGARGTLTIARVGILSNVFATERNGKSMGQGSLVGSARHFIEEWGRMGELTPEPDSPPITDIDILLRCAAGVSLKLSAVTSEVLVLHEIIAGMVDDVG